MCKTFFKSKNKEKIWFKKNNENLHKITCFIDIYKYVYGTLRSDKPKQMPYST